MDQPVTGWVDDVVFDQPHPPAPQTLAAVAAIFDVLEQAAASTTTFFAEPAWRDLCRQFKQFLGVKRLQHFSHGIRMMYGSTALLLVGYLHALPLSVSHYETLRRYRIGLIPSFELSGICADLQLRDRDRDRYSPAVQQLTAHANNIISWSNVRYSLGDELEQRGRYENIVIAYASQGCTLQEAISRVSDRMRNEFAHFSALCTLLSQRNSAPLDAYIRDLQTWIVGHQLWMQDDTARYLTTLTNNAWEHYAVDFEHHPPPLVNVSNL
ncbi:hypothetical protein BBG20_19435 [Pseudomonas aylmerensis]|uniref:Uncharacterized protein n=1 Tax=Pseudomonas aylmerensis TaxID=1869229 RepID=A0ABX2YSX8_9PSED|nr:hypothetical protein BBG20_19435 [Pseudomonas aylmerensis]